MERALVRHEISSVIHPLLFRCYQNINDDYRQVPYLGHAGCLGIMIFSVVVAAEQQALLVLAVPGEEN